MNELRVGATLCLPRFRVEAGKATGVRVMSVVTVTRFTRARIWFVDEHGNSGVVNRSEFPDDSTPLCE